MLYEWSREKSVRNQEKHGISFELATLVFEDDQCLVLLDRADEQTGELRWVTIGKAQPSPEAAVVLLVVHVYRENIYGQEIIRIISARGADKRDVRRYQEQALDES